jgi:hypothetical protein
VGSIIDYELTTGDIAAAQSLMLDDTLASSRSPSVFLVTMLLRMAAFLGFAEIGLFVTHTRALYVVLLLVLALALIFRYYLVETSRPQGLGKWVEGVFKQGANVQAGKHSLSVTSETLMDSFGRARTTTRWSKVEQVKSDAQRAVIAVKDSSPYVVPVRAFASESEFRQFVDMAEGYRSTAKR